VGLFIIELFLKVLFVMNLVKLITKFGTLLKLLLQWSSMVVFECIQSLRNHLRGVNTSSNFNSISLKNHKGNIIIWIVKFFLEIGSPLLVAAAAAESDPFVVMSME
jgi:hypothetical protein